MSWEELPPLAGAGWEVGSHSRSHPHLTQLTDSALRDELVGSRELLEQRLGRPCRTLAYPYGDVDSRVVEATTLAGYAFACTAPVGHPLSLPLRWGRVGSFRSDSQRRFRLLPSRAARGFLATATGTL